MLRTKSMACCHGLSFLKIWDLFNQNLVRCISRFDDVGSGTFCLDLCSAKGICSIDDIPVKVKNGNLSRVVFYKDACSLG